MIRNSWGCGAGDNGYYYVPADYVSILFSTLEALDFDVRRSLRWSQDQVVPGGASGLTIDPRGTLGADLRVRTDLASQFAVAHPVASYVRLRVTSNLDGLLFDGQWLVNEPIGGSLFANALPATFQTEGLRTLTITATYGSQVVSATKDVLVLNSAPAIRLLTSGTPQQGESFVINAEVTDINEPNPAGLCDAMQWTLDDGDAIVSGSGCTRVVRFGSTGRHLVRVVTHDREGREGFAVGMFDVAPPPANPFPRIASFGLFARDSLLVGGRPSGCWSNPVSDNTTIDLRQLGCDPLGVNVPDVSRYVANARHREPGRRGPQLRLDLHHPRRERRRPTGHHHHQDHDTQLRHEPDPVRRA